MEEKIITIEPAPEEIVIADEDPTEGVEETVVPVIMVEDVEIPKDLKIAVGESLGIGERVG